VQLHLKGHGFNEQILGADKQVPGRGQSDQSRNSALAGKGVVEESLIEVLYCFHQNNECCSSHTKATSLVDDKEKQCSISTGTVGGCLLRGVAALAATTSFAHQSFSSEAGGGWTGLTSLAFRTWLSV